MRREAHQHRESFSDFGFGFDQAGGVGADKHDQVCACVCPSTRLAACLSVCPSVCCGQHITPDVANEVRLDVPLHTLMHAHAYAHTHTHTQHERDRDHRRSRPSSSGWIAQTNYSQTRALAHAHIHEIHAHVVIKINAVVSRVDGM